MIKRRFLTGFILTFGVLSVVTAAKFAGVSLLGQVTPTIVNQTTAVTQIGVYTVAATSTHGAVRFADVQQADRYWNRLGPLTAVSLNGHALFGVDTASRKITFSPPKELPAQTFYIAVKFVDDTGESGWNYFEWKATNPLSTFSLVNQSTVVGQTGIYQIPFTGPTYATVKFASVDQMDSYWNYIGPLSNANFHGHALFTVNNQTREIKSVFPIELPAQTFYIRVKMVDQAGQETGYQMFEWKAKNDGSTFTLANQTTNVGLTGIYQIPFTGPSYATVKFSAVDQMDRFWNYIGPLTGAKFNGLAVFDVNNQTRTITSHFPIELPAQTFYIRVKMVDQAGQETGFQTFEWKATNQASTFTLANQTTNVGQPGTYQIPFTGPAYATVTFDSVDQMDRFWNYIGPLTGAKFNGLAVFDVNNQTRTITSHFPIELPAQTFYIRVGMVDQAGQKTGTLTFEWKAINPGPDFTVVNKATDAGAPSSTYTIAAIAPSYASVHFLTVDLMDRFWNYVGPLTGAQFNGLPLFVVDMSNRKITFSPPLTIPRQAFNIRVSMEDQAGQKSGQKTFTWTACSPGEGCGIACGNGQPDPDERCDEGRATNGTAGSCCDEDCTLKPAGITCRPAVVSTVSGVQTCDVVEQCDGVAPKCPVDKFRPATFVCRENPDHFLRDLCDPKEKCTGNSAVCPADVIYASLPRYVRGGIVNPQTPQFFCRDITYNTCPNGTLDAGEECDDHNYIDTDACISTCKNSKCGDGHTWAGHEQCDDGNTVNTDDCRNDCTLPVCGDGFFHFGVEICDDGNHVNGDGCSASCVSEQGNDCQMNAQGISVCNRVCGDKIVVPGIAGAPGETCDAGRHCRNTLRPCTTKADCRGYAPRPLNADNLCYQTICLNNPTQHCTQSSNCPALTAPMTVNVLQAVTDLPDDICATNIPNIGCFNCQLEQGWTCTVGQGCVHTPAPGL